MASEKEIPKVLARLEYGVYVVTMGNDDGGNAFTASWLSQVASVPAMIAVSIKNDHESARLLKEDDAFAVNLLSREATSVAKTYYGPAEAGFKKLQAAPLDRAPSTGCPLIPGRIGFLDCKIVKRVPAGDHTVFFGEVLDAKLHSDVEILTSSSSRLRYAG